MLMDSEITWAAGTVMLIVTLKRDGDHSAISSRGASVSLDALLDVLLMLVAFLSIKSSSRRASISLVEKFDVLFMMVELWLDAFLGTNSMGHVLVLLGHTRIKPGNDTVKVSPMYMSRFSAKESDIDVAAPAR